MARGFNRVLSYLIIVAFLSVSTNLPYLSKQKFQNQTDALRSQAAAIALDIDAMKAKLESPGTEASVPKSFLSGIILDPAIKLSLQKHLDRLLELRRDPNVENIAEQLGVMLELPATAVVDIEVRQTLRNFGALIKAEFGEDIEYKFIYPKNDLTQSVKGSRDSEGYADAKISISLRMTSSKSVAPKSSSGGVLNRVALDATIKAEVETQLNKLIQSIKDSEAMGSTERIGTRFELSGDAFRSNEFQDMLVNFINKIKDVFGRDAFISVADNSVNKENGLHVGVLVEPNSAIALKSSSGGTIIKSRAEKTSALTMNVESNVAVKEKFDRAIAKLNGLDAVAVSAAKDAFEGIKKELYLRHDDIKQILSDSDPDVSPADKTMLEDMALIQYKAEQHISNIETITRANKGTLAEDTTPRVMILPAISAVSNQAELAKDEIRAIENNLGVITVVSNDPVGAIEAITSGTMEIGFNGNTIQVPASNIAVLLTESRKGMASEVSRALGTKNTLVISNIGNSQYVPFSQLAMLAKVQLILSKIGVESKKAGPYRSAFLVIWKSVTGSPFFGDIGQFIADPVAYVISILSAPESLLSETEIEILHNKAAKIWA